MIWAATVSVMVVVAPGLHGLKVREVNDRDHLAIDPHKPDLPG